MELILVYWAAVGLLLLIGFIQLIVNSINNKPLKPALTMLIIGVVLLVVGAGACAVILGGLNIQ